MNTRAFEYEGLNFQEKDFELNRVHKTIRAIRKCIVQLKNGYRLAAAVRKERLELMQLSDRMLKDIGTTREEALQEASSILTRS